MGTVYDARKFLLEPFDYALNSDFTVATREETNTYVSEWLYAAEILCEHKENPSMFEAEMVCISSSLLDLIAEASPSVSPSNITNLTSAVPR